ncbi:hypothetical protein ACFQKO_59670, partial [Nonomuraea rubra]
RPTAPDPAAPPPGRAQGAGAVPSDGDDTQTSARRGRSRQRLVIAAAVTAALALSGAAVAVIAPWRAPDADPAPVAAASTPPAGQAADPPVVTPTPPIDTPSPKDLELLDKPQDKPKTVVPAPSTPPASTAPPTRRVRTPKPAKSSPTVEVPDDGGEPPSEEPAAPVWRCRSWLATGSGVEMSPCMAVVGDTIHLKGQIRGSASVRSDVHVQLYDTDADTNRSQPFICTGVAPPGAGGVAVCGPFTMTAPRTGAKTDVRQRWRVTGGSTWGGGAESPWVLW